MAGSRPETSKEKENRCKRMLQHKQSFTPCPAFGHDKVAVCRHSTQAAVTCRADSTQQRITHPSTAKLP